VSKFDYDKIKDMEYDPSRDRYIGKDGSELKVTPYSDGSGYKYDYYDSSTYGNSSHSSTHVKSDLNENWNRTDNDRENGAQEKSSGTGCYLTSACMKNYNKLFNDNCEELRVLRWFRDNFVSKEDIEHYYQVAPIIVESIDKDFNREATYNYIYENIISPCVIAIKTGDYDYAYKRYKTSVLAFEEVYAKKELQKRLVKVLRKVNNSKYG